MYKLPVFATLRIGYGFVWRERRDLVAYALLPVLLTTFTSVFMATTGVGQNEYFNPVIGINGEGPSQFLKFSVLNNGGPLPNVVGTIFLLLQMWLFIAFQVAWIRRHLIGPAPNPSGAVFQWRRRHFRYTSYLIVTLVLLMVVLVLFFFVFAFIDSFLIDDKDLATTENSAYAIVHAIALAIGFLLTHRLWLIFPASALDDERITLRVSRKITKGNMWRIWMVIGLGNLWLFYGIWELYLELAFNGVFVSALQNSIALFSMAVLILEASGFALAATSASLLAATYRQFVDNVPLETAPAGPGTV